MKGSEESVVSVLVFYRIVAFWAVCEGMLGGLMHGFNLPGTGLIVSSASVICISMIAWYFPVKGMILKATMLVGIFKMMLSPHSPPTAYVAVFFQGLVGELLFHRRRAFKVSCVLLAVLALVESAIQRLLVLTMVYGTELWKAVDIFLSKITGETTVTSYSWYIASLYVLLHFFAGIVVGRFAGGLPQRMTSAEPLEISVIEVPKEKKRKNRLALFFTWIILLVLYLQSELGIGEPVLPSSLPLRLILRSVVIILLWYFVFSPLLIAAMKRWLRRKQSLLRDDVEAVVALLPSMRHLLVSSWKGSSEASGWKRLKLFSKISLSRVVHDH